MKVIVKEKANKHKVEREMNHMSETLTNSAMRLDQIFTGLEMSIVKATSGKAEMTDIESIERSKADISEIKRLEEKIERLEKVVEERMRSKDESEEGEDEEEIEDYDEEEDDLMEEFEEGGQSPAVRKGFGDSPTPQNKGGYLSDPEIDPEELKDKIVDNFLKPTIKEPNSHSSENLTIKIQPPPSPITPGKPEGAPGPLFLGGAGTNRSVGAGDQDSIGTSNSLKDSKANASPAEKAS